MSMNLNKDTNYNKSTFSAYQNITVPVHELEFLFDCISLKLKVKKKQHTRN